MLGCGRIGFGNGGPSHNVDAPNGAFCLGPSGWSVCMTSVPTQPLTLPNTIDTSLASSCQTAGVTMSGQPSVCFIVATDITIASDVTVDGSEPLVLVATNTIAIDAALDVSAYHAGGTGPGGGSSASCQAFPSAPHLDNSGGGGGAGASFMTAGGRGGTGNGNAATAGASPPADSTAPDVLRPGCRGQDGGDGIGTSSHGTGGSGGGAVYLLAGTSITIGATGRVDASGAAGSFLTSNQFFGGGGGGGSGGMIVLFAPSIDATAGAVLMANAGGGSAGASGSQVGNPGTEPTSPTSPAAGGTTPGGAGGSGYAIGTSATAGGPGPNNFGGGGGGGGAGYIRSNVALGSASVSPAVTIVP